MATYFKLVNFSRELNGEIVSVVGFDAARATGRIVATLVRTKENLALREEHLAPLGYFETLCNMVDLEELKANARCLCVALSKSTKLHWLGVAIVAAILSSSAHNKRAKPPRARATAAPRTRRRDAPPAYALGYSDAQAGRVYGFSRRAQEEDQEDRDLVEATLRDLPPETQGVREAWAAQTGWKRKEHVRE